MLRSQLRWIASADALTVLNFHRIDDRGKSSGASMTPAVFGELLNWLKQNFRIVTFAELEHVGRKGLPPAVLTFDDGYKDFIQVVAPILGKCGIRVNQNVVPTCVQNGYPPMNVALQDFIRAAPAKLLRDSIIPQVLPTADVKDKEQCAYVASAALKNRPIAEQKLIFAQLTREFERLDSFRPTPVMSLSDILQIRNEHEIGVHSWEHATMAVESQEYLVGDAARCRTWLQQAVGIEPHIYAFPNGAASHGQAQMVRRAGFRHVLSVTEDFSRRDAWFHPRFTMHAQTPSEARFRASGAMSSARTSSFHRRIVLWPRMAISKDTIHQR
jgi:peptidoglycan/xylan/chitin deacetylase (PgdA/CDA1 family)